MIIRQQRDARVEILLFLGIVFLCGMGIRFWHEQKELSNRNLGQQPGLFWNGRTLQAGSRNGEGRGDAYIPAHMTPFFFQPLPVNLADAELLTTISGVGPELAQRIVEIRQRQGPFQGPRDLLAVPGIGPARMAQFAPQFSFQISETLDKENAERAASR